MTITRRDLLKGGALLSAAAALPSFLKPARAQSAPQARKLIMVLNSGGWDQTWALDPKPGLPLVDAPPGALRSVGGLTYWSDPTGRPAVDAFFDRWAANTAVINGVQVRSFVH